jgi:hypothetical protein
VDRAIPDLAEAEERYEKAREVLRNFGRAANV